MKLKRPFLRDERGAGAIEFALLAPALFGFIIGVSQLGELFFANADVRNAVAAGARTALIWPRPDDATIIARVNEMTVGLDPAHITAPTVIHGNDGDRDWADISMSYAVPLDFIFFQTPAVTLTETRRVYIQPVAAADDGSGGSSTSSTSTGGDTSTSSTSTGGDTSTSSTSTGGTTSASSTSTGGDTSTSSTSTGGTTSTSSTSTSTSSTSTGGGSSNGGGNSNGGGGNSNGGHDHGCKKNC